jgi:hypothetical protein
MPDVENTIEPRLAGYIDKSKLEALLEKIFKRKIVVYVGAPTPFSQVRPG